MTRLFAATAWLAAFIASIGAGLFDPWLMAVGGIGAAVAAGVWGFFRDDGVRWRWMGERYGEPGYTGEISYDSGQTWVDEHLEEEASRES